MMNKYSKFLKFNIIQQQTWRFSYVLYNSLSNNQWLISKFNFDFVVYIWIGLRLIEFLSATDF